MKFLPKNYNPVLFQNFFPLLEDILITINNKLSGSSQVKTSKNETVTPLPELKTETKVLDSELDEKSIAWEREAEAFINKKCETVISHRYMVEAKVSNSSEIPHQMKMFLKEISPIKKQAREILANFKNLNEDDQKKLQPVKMQLRASRGKIRETVKTIKVINKSTLYALRKVESDFQTGNLGFKAIRDSQTMLQNIMSPFQNSALERIDILENQHNLMDRLASYNVELPNKEHLNCVENGNSLPFIKNVLHKLNVHYTQARERGQVWNLPIIKSRAVAVIDLFASKLDPTQKGELRNFLSDDKLFIHHHRSISFFRNTDTWSTLNKSLREPPQSSCEKFSRFIGF